MSLVLEKAVVEVVVVAALSVAAPEELDRAAATMPAATLEACDADMAVSMAAAVAVDRALSISLVVDCCCCCCWFAPAIKYS